MKDNLKWLFFIIFVAFIFNSCQKYQGDSFVSLQTPYYRLVGFNWQIVSYQINATEHSHDFDSLLTPETLTDFNLIFGPYYSGDDYTAFCNFKDNSGKDLNIHGKGETNDFYWDFQNLTFNDNSNNGVINFHGWGQPGNGNMVPVSTDNFYNFFFQPITTSATNWNVIELDQHKLHLHNGKVDIYFKK